MDASQIKALVFDVFGTVVDWHTSVTRHGENFGKAKGVAADRVIPINDTLGFHPNAAPLNDMFDAGDVAVIQGIGYENSSRSHFRAMDIWHTAEPNSVATEGRLGQAVAWTDRAREEDV